MSSENKKTILIVEDEAVLAMSEKVSLENYAYNVITVNSGEKAVESVKLNPEINLILMDIDLGNGIDGTQAAEIILKNKDIPIVFLSSHTESEIVEKTEKITSYGYVVKSSSITVLDASIKMAFKLFEAKRLERIKHELLKVSEDRLSKTMLAANDGMWDWNLIANRVYFDPRYYQMSGYEIDEFPHSLEEFQKRVHPAEVEYVMKEAEKHLNGKSDYFDVKFRFRKKNGGWQWIQGKGIIVERSSSGVPQRFIGTHRDISELKQKEEELRESELTFRKLFEDSADAILLIDKQGVFVECNQAALSLLKMTKDQFLFKSPVEISPEYQPDGQNSKEKAFRMIDIAYEKGLHRFEWTCESTDGKNFIVEVSLMPIKLKGEIFLHTTWRDITERKQAEVKIRESEETLSITLQSIGDAVIATDILGNITRMNATAEQLTGWDFQDAKGQPLPGVFKIINAFTREMVENPVEKVIGTGKIIGLANHTVLISKNGNEYQISDSAAPIRDNAGIIKGVILVFSDVTEKYAAEDALRNSAAKFRETLDKIPFPIAIVDLQDDQIFFWSHSALELFGHNASTASEWYMMAYPDPDYRKDIIERWKNFLEKARSSGKTVNAGEYQITCKNGSVRICELYATVLSDSLIVTFNDITERKQAESNLKQIEWMLSSNRVSVSSFQSEHDQGYGDLIALNHDGLILKSIGIELLKNFADDYLELLGTSSAIYEENGDYAFGIFSSGWCRMMDSASRKLCNTSDNKEALESGKWLCHESCWACSKEAIAQQMPIDIECAGGIRIYAEPIIVGGRAVGAINFGYGNPPVSREKQQELADKFHLSCEELAFKSSEYEIRPQYIINMAKKRLHTTALLIASIIEKNLVEEALNGTKQLLSESEKIGKVGGWEFNIDTLKQNWTEETFHIHEVDLNYDHTVENGINFYTADSKPIIENAVRRAIEFKEPFDLELKIITAKGNLRHVHTIGKIDLPNRKIIGFFQDITGRKNAEEEIKRQLSEKENLLKEVHHRIKNNIASIEGLLRMQADSTENTEVKNALLDAISRVQSIRVLYEKLLLGKDYQEISVKSYIESLVDSLVLVLSDSRNVTIEKRLTDFTLNSNLVIPIGIIINELFTNIFKYAFKGKIDGLISITLDKTDDQVTLTIKDNGIGIDARFFKNKTPGFGLTIVKMLSEQLKGTYTIENDNGAKSVLKFKI